LKLVDYRRCLEHASLQKLKTFSLSRKNEFKRQKLIVRLLHELFHVLSLSLGSFDSLIRNGQVTGELFVLLPEILLQKSIRHVILTLGACTQIKARGLLSLN
jgi:hypothetical protein